MLPSFEVILVIEFIPNHITFRAALNMQQIRSLSLQILQHRRSCVTRDDICRHIYDSTSTRARKTKLSRMHRMRAHRGLWLDLLKVFDDFRWLSLHRKVQRVRVCQMDIILTNAPTSCDMHIIIYMHNQID